MIYLMINKNLEAGSIYVRALMLLMLLLLPVENIYSQYTKGDMVSTDDLNKTFMYCSNDRGTSTIGELLNPDGGIPVRALWINFFASW